jgi:opacity protein-like surface antigen
VTTTTRWSLALAIPAALATLAIEHAPASADRGVHVRGGVQLSASASASVRVRPYSRGAGRYHRPRPRPVVRYYPSYYWGGGVYFGVRYASPPPCYYNECGPYYYSNYGYPTYHRPAVVAAQPAPRPDLPRFGLGLFAGGTTLQGGDHGSDLGVVGRFRLTPHLQIEGEIAKSELFEGQRIDRSMGGALLYDFAPWSRLSLYLLGGLGAGSTEVAGDISADHVYGELGIGLDWRLTERLSLIADLRAGQRAIERDGGDRLLLRAGPTLAPVEEEQDYTRGRVGLLLFF